MNKRKKNWHSFPLCLHAGESKVNSLYTFFYYYSLIHMCMRCVGHFFPWLSQAVFYPLSLSDHQNSKPVSQNIQLWSCGSRQPEEPRPAPILGHVFYYIHKVSPTPNSFLKSRHFLSEMGWQTFDELTLPVLFVQRIINLISFSLKSCSHFFVNWHCIPGTGFLVTWLTLPSQESLYCSPVLLVSSCSSREVDFTLSYDYPHNNMAAYDLVCPGYLNLYPMSCFNY
jgi:hypothetical protein